jgi:hypothetical protein
LRGKNPESHEAQAHQSSNNDDDEAHQTLKGYRFEGSEGAIGQRVNVSHAPLMERW